MIQYILSAYLLVVIFHYIQMVKAVQSVDLRDELLFFPLLHSTIVKFFPAKNLIVSLALNFKHISKATCNKSKQCVR